MGEKTDLSRLQFVNEQEREYFLRAKLGIEIVSFLNSEIGKYLHGRAKQQYQKAQQEAIEVDVSSWFGRRKFKKIQQKAEIAQAFMRWCVDAVVDGQNAERELEEQ